MLHFFNPENIIYTFGYAGIFSIVFFESGFFFAFFFPGDTLLFSVGFLSAQGLLNFQIVLFGFMIATFLGSLFGYFFGKKVGDKIFSKKNSFLFNPKNLERTRIFYEKYGKWTMALCRFFPFIRTFAPILAGVAKMNFKTFLKYNILGSIIWPSIVVSAGYFFGSFIPSIHDYVLPVIGIVFLFTLVPIAWAILKEFRKRYLDKKKKDVSNNA